jgi:hypothetical protein
MSKLQAYIGYKLIFWALLFIPAYLAVKQIQSIHFGQKLQQEGELVMGEVISVETRTTVDEDGETSTYYKPLVQYNIDKKVFRTDLQECMVPYKKGEMIELLYMKESPNKVTHNHFEVLFTDYIALLVIILLATIIIGAVVYFILRKQALKYI